MLPPLPSAPIIVADIYFQLISPFPYHIHLGISPADSQTAA